MRYMNRLIQLGIGTLIFAASLPGWCPPLPSLSPYPVVMQFEATLVNDRTMSLTATISLAPSACFDGPSCPPLFFGDFPVNISGDASEFTIDASRTTCTHG